MKITIESDIRKMQVNLPDTSTTMAVERSLFAMLNGVVESYYSEKDSNGKVEENETD